VCQIGGKAMVTWRDGIVYINEKSEIVAFIHFSIFLLRSLCYIIPGTLIFDHFLFLGDFDFYILFQRE